VSMHDVTEVTNVDSRQTKSENEDNADVTLPLDLSSTFNVDVGRDDFNNSDDVTVMNVSIRMLYTFTSITSAGQNDPPAIVF